MKLKNNLIRILICAGLLVATQAQAGLLARTGTITRTLTDHRNYGGCMIHISTIIGDGCPSSGWVSLDCDAVYSSPGEGNRAYTTALTAFSLGNRVSVYVENTEKHNGFCVARRLDILAD